MPTLPSPAVHEDVPAQDTKRDGAAVQTLYGEKEKPNKMDGKVR